MADIGVETLFRRWNTSTGQWVNLAGFTELSYGEQVKDKVESTALDTVGRVKTYIMGLKNPPEVRGTLNFKRSVWDILQADYDSDTAQNYEIVAPDADTTSVEFAGNITTLGPVRFLPNDRITAEVIISIVGVAQIESGSGS